ncbi:MobF family relaxase [Actinomycetospora soli]|uniref:MobF family relaxase n=1 Tax=Actinomycetospora soli TaxID=2893887 RepID=UPI001E3228C9|nr:MobF family relaxase [Actinomycetospora soli]MCD2191721.1 AAA family ATPase [Actinomycetospora soli]
MSAVGVVRIQAIGPGAVEYLLHGCDPAEPEPGTEREPGQELEADGAEPGLEAQVQPQRESGVGYFLDDRGEPAGRWLGTGMQGLGLSYRAGDTARENDLRALFGELRFPGSQRPGSTKDTPIYLGAKPRNYQTLAERVDAALKAEPDATPERQREIEVTTARNSRSNTAYYDVTFSPVKSVSVYYAALLAAGDVALAQAVRDAHDQAVRLAVESAEAQVAWAKTGRHGRASPSGRTTGEWQKATGLSAVLFGHHTNRDGEPQLHAHVAVLNRVALDDGRVYALDGAAFRPVKDAMASMYDRAMEAILSDLTGVVWVERPDGHGREIAGIDPTLLEEASSRTREHVEPRIEELVAAYQERHGHEPGPQARRKIVDQAVKDTRRPKTGPAGPAAVAAWVAGVDGRAQRLTAALDEVDAAVIAAAAGGHPEPMATGYVADRDVATGRELGAGGHELADGRTPVTESPEALAARIELGARAVAAGLESVQAKYPSWSIGALHREIDNHLGAAAGAVGLAIAERHAWVADLARTAVAPGPDGRVVQVSMGDPVPIPPELRREVDGRSRFRAPIDERYVSAAHLSLEERLVATAQAPTAPSLDPETVGRVADRARRAGLSVDQVQAVAEVLASPRQVEVLVGPAGAGKSHTLAQLAQAWQAEHGGRVIGTAAAEVATRNLRDLGTQAELNDSTQELAELGFLAANFAKLRRSLEPDEHGRVRLTLQANDLLVIDEAGMATTSDLDALTRHAARAGAKVIWAGDHHQLPAVGAGGLFAHLAEQPGAIELETVHRFSAAWEREASLRLRVGDAAVAPVYANEGRLRAGTLEQMEYLATRDYLADRVAGVSGLLIVGSNQRAELLSRDIQSQLADLGLVGREKIAELRGGTGLRMGDLIQAREGNASLRVDAPVDADGQRGEAMPVANRQVFTVVGYDADTSTVLARDEHGAIAHLTKEYVRKQVTLAYAVTNHAAQGVTVDRARALAERGMSAEALYPASTRGRHLNVIYLQTEVDPDPHAPQRERDTAVSALVRILENDAGELTDAALTVAANAAIESRSMLTLAEHYERVAAEQGHTRHAALAVAELGAGIAEERAFAALLGRMRAVELEGHDITAIFGEAKEMASFRGARELAKVMHWRLGVLQESRTPERTREEVVDGQRTVRPAWDQLAEQHRARAAETGDAVEGVLAALARRAHERSEELGQETVASAPTWAIEWLGPIPDATTESAAHAVWARGAGQVAAYREWRGIPDEQVSIGAAPPPAQQLAHELWSRAAAAGAGDPRVVDWRKASDQELRAAIRRWDLRQQWAPVPVAEERGEALALVHDATNDAVLGRARLDTMAVDHPERARLVERVHADEVMAEQAQAFADSLDQAHLTREAWWEASRDVREAALSASHELDRRGLPRVAESEPGQSSPTFVEPDADGPAFGHPDPGEPEPAAAAPDRPEQQPFDLDPKAATELDQDAASRSERHQQFLDRLAYEHEQALAAVDPDGTMDRDTREAVLRARNFEVAVEHIRAEHGARLDPEQVLSDVDLASARALELADLRRRAADLPVIEPHPVGAPDLEQTPPVEHTAGVNLGTTVNEPSPATPEVGPSEEPAAQTARSAVRPAAWELPSQDGPHQDAASGPPGRRGGEELRQTAREMRAARIAREVEQAHQTQPGEPSPQSGRPAVAPEFDRESALDDELSTHRSPQQAQQRQLELERQRERDWGPEID